MNWHNVLDFRTYGDIATEIAWKSLPKKNYFLTPSWPIDARKIKDISILWPHKYSWSPMEIWVTPILSGLRRFASVKIADIPQTYKGVVLFRISRGGRLYDMAIDIHDKSEWINEDCAANCFLYLKMQYLKNGYRLSSVVPAGFVPYSNEIYGYLPYLRKIRDAFRPQYDVYGRFDLKFSYGIRSKLHQILSEQKQFGYAGGVSKVRYSRFLREVTRSKICIDLPGNGDFCFRLIDYFAVGACVISIKHKTVLNTPLINREHIVYMKDDASDLVELCNFYLNNDREREALCQNSRDFFDKYLHREQLAAYYLYKFFEKLGEK